MTTNKRTAKSTFRRPPIFGRRKRTRLLRLAIAGIVSLALTWEVISRSVAAYLADVAPETALWLNAQEPTALINVADRMLKLSEQSGRSNARALSELEQWRKEARNLAESAVMSEPINARAARMLGQLADTINNDAYAYNFMDAAVQFSLHETFAGYWMMKKKFENQNYEEAIHCADIILRINPEFGSYIFPTLAKMTESIRTNDAIKAVLAGNPPWRARFLAVLPDSITEVKTPLAILLALRASSAPPTLADIDSYLRFLIGRKLFDLAYYTWLQFLPPERLSDVRLLFNGSFEISSSSGPFDWTIRQGSGVTVDIVQRSDDSTQHALLVQFQYGRVDFHDVAQLVVLSPGIYKFNGKYMGGIAGPKGFKWRIACANESTTLLGEGTIADTAFAWNNFEFLFVVPDADCRAQYIRLDLDARISSERLLSGSVLFDELEILRLVAPPT